MQHRLRDLLLPHRDELHRRLQRLKQEKRNGLYVKVIFPGDSGLTYDEAWRFTSDLHSRYDYYSQEPPVEVPTEPAAPDSGQ